MKKIISKVLVLFMLFTTVTFPVDLSFADNETSVESSAASSEQNTSVESDIHSDQNISKDQANSGDQQEKIDETLTEDMHFLYVESEELAAPGTQNIAVSWK